MKETKIIKKLSMAAYSLLILTSSFAFADTKSEPATRVKAQKYCVSTCPKNHIAVDVISLEQIMEQIIARAENYKTELPEGLLKCYDRLQKGYNTLHRDELLEAVPAIVKELEYWMDEQRAPRPDAPGVNSPFAIVGPGTCDLTEVIRLLNELQQDLEECCLDIEVNFQGTFTVLEEILSTLTVEFQGTFTVLADIETTLTTCCADVLANFCSPTLIRQTDFGPGGTTPYIILAPGVYKLAENIVYNPTTATPAIDIDASGVVLDLQCFSLTQGNSTQDVDGIFVEAGDTDILIQNGQIQSFTRAGISVQDSAQRVGVQDLTCLDCGVRGIEFVSTATTVAPTILDSFIDNVAILFSGTASDVGNNALLLQGCQDVRVTNVLCNNNGIATQDLDVIELANCFKCLLENVVANDNVASQTLNAVSLDSTTSLCTFKNCSVKNNEAVGTLSTSRGYVLIGGSGSVNNEFINCAALSNIGNGAVDGFLTSTGCDNNLFIDCESSYHSTLGDAAISQAHGFNAVNNINNTFENCLSRNVTAPSSIAPLGDFGAYGFDLNTTGSCSLIRCESLDHSAGAGSNSVGIRVINGTWNGIQKCLAARNDIGYRLDPSGSTQHYFIKNVAGKNIIQYSQFPAGSTQSAADISGINAGLTVPWTNIAIG